MKVLWNTEIIDKSNKTVYQESNKSNLIMNYAASLYLHRLMQPVAPSIYDLLKFVVFGSSAADPNSTNKEILETEIDRALIDTNFRYENLDDSSVANVLVVEYSYENNTGSDVIINERGVVSGGLEYTDIGWTGDWNDRLQTGYLFSRKVESVPLIISDGAKLYGSIKITTDIF